tara:strand:+ start:8083 stop:8304 length:222 start_codon:yes stop_codon:yes gene_type:complete
MEDFVNTSFNMILQDLKNVTSNTFSGVQVTDQNQQNQPLPSELQDPQSAESLSVNEITPLVPQNLTGGGSSVY